MGALCCVEISILCCDHKISLRFECLDELCHSLLVQLPVLWSSAFPPGGGFLCYLPSKSRQTVGEIYERRRSGTPEFWLVLVMDLFAFYISAQYWFGRVGGGGEFQLTKHIGGVVNINKIKTLTYLSN